MKKKLALVTLSDTFASYKILTESIRPYLTKAFETDFYTERTILELDVGSYDIIYMNKNSSAAAAGIAAQASARGIPLVYETDDNFLAGGETESGTAHTHSPAMQKHLAAIATIATAILVYSRQSCIDFSRLNRNVAILPTYQNVYAQEPPVFGSLPPIIGFMGSSCKDLNFTWVMPALRKIAETRPGVRFEFLGFLPAGAETLPNLSHCADYLDYGEFIKAFRQKQWTIGLAPLADAAFNHSKTNNKYREYAAAGYAGVYSRVEPYSNTVRAGETGLLAGNTPEEWLKAITLLLDNESLRAEIARNAWHDIKTNYGFENYCRAKMSFLLKIAADSSASGVRKAVRAATDGNRQISV